MNAIEIYQSAERILSTLPKAHYLKADTIAVDLDPTAPTSYFDPTKWAIKVSLLNILQAVQAKAATLSDEDLEATIRALCYHEVSHAMLTPTETKYCADRYGVGPDLANIIEDERIETINRHLFIGVDFKANIRAIAPYQAPKDFEQWVFVALRLRKAPFGLREALEAFADFLKATKAIGASSKAGAYRLAIAMSELADKLRAIFNKYATPAQQGQPQNNGNQPQQSGGQERQGNGEDAQGQDQQDGQPIPTEDGETADESAEGADQAQGNGEEADKGEEAEAGQGGEEAPEESDEEPDGMDIDEDESKRLMQNASADCKRQAERYSGKCRFGLSDFAADPEAKVGMLKAIIRNKGVGVATAPTIAAYNGKFNVRRYIRDQHLTMKWFDKTLADGDRENRKAAKKVLNIYLDQSGSFDGHDAKVNEILKALAEIEASRDDFEWNLIKISDYGANIVEDKDRRFSESEGGTCLPLDGQEHSIAAAARKVDPRHEALNIVLFDGAIFGSWVSVSQASACLARPELNTKKTIVISEQGNRPWFRSAFDKVREIIWENADYEGRLAANIVRAFDLLF